MYKFDVCSSEQFITKLCTIHNINKSHKLDKILEQFMLSNPIKLTETKYDGKMEYARLNELKVGDIVRIEYIPASQKYIDYYTDIIGQVIYIDVDNDDMLIANISGDTTTIYSMEREHCSYYGDTRGYDYVINLNK